MKTIIILGDGMADNPIEQLGGKTPLQYANTPYMDLLAKNGRTGRLVTVPVIPLVQRLPIPPSSATTSTRCMKVVDLLRLLR